MTREEFNDFTKSIYSYNALISNAPFMRSLNKAWKEMGLEKG